MFSVVFILKSPEGFEACGERGIEDERPARKGMDEFETDGVEADATDWVFTSAVTRVAENGVASHLAMDADLVFASCFKNNTKIGEFA